MTSPYGLDQAQMQAVINATDDAISQMTTLNGTVQARADDIYSHAQSDAGRILQQRLTTWNTDFAAIVNALIDLNTNVQQWLYQSVTTGADAGSAAGSAPGSRMEVGLHLRSHFATVHPPGTVALQPGEIDVPPGTVALQPALFVRSVKP